MQQRHRIYYDTGYIICIHSHSFCIVQEHRKPRKETRKIREKKHKKKGKRDKKKKQWEKMKTKGSRVRIPQRAQMFVSCICCVLCR
jgi:hypothetical protein